MCFVVRHRDAIRNLFESFENRVSEETPLQETRLTFYQVTSISILSLSQVVL